MVVILKHVPYEGPGIIADILEGRGLPFKTLEIHAGDPLPLSPAGLTGVISMGGPMSVNDGLPFIDREQGFLVEAIDRGLPVLGVCLGAQIIAKALGAEVYPGEQAEVGWGEVNVSEEGSGDPIFSSVGEEIPVLHWHGETFDLPEGASHLASSPLYANQAFRWGECVYGLQFHLEATREMIREWVREDGDMDDDGLEVDGDAILNEMPAVIDGVHLTASLVFGRFMDRLRELRDKKT